VDLMALAEGGGLPPNQPHYEVYRNGWSSLDEEEILQAVAVLEDHGWRRTDRVVTGGRPSLRCLMNPRLRSEL
jgi:hypothetical protein